MTTYEWDVQESLIRWHNRAERSLTNTFTAQSRPIPADTDISDERLAECYRLMAQIVTTYGDTYLPIFERLHNEIEERQARQELVRQAKAIADRPYE